MIRASFFTPASFKSKAFIGLKTLFLLLSSYALVSCTCSNTPKIKIVRTETFFNNLGGVPENLHPIRSTDAYSNIIQSHVLESLLQRDLDTYEWKASLAKKWTISPDGRTFTFYLYKGLKWSDGKDLTADDVKFSLEAFKDPKYGGIHAIPYFEGLKSIEVIDSHTLRVRTKDLYFGNFQVIAGMQVLPKHIYFDPKKKLSKTVIGSGPYFIEHNIKGKILILKKNPLWKVQEKNSANKGQWIFNSIVFRFIQGEDDTLLRLQRGDIDFAAMSPESYTQKTGKAPWGQTILKEQIQLQKPKGYTYIGMNLRKDILKDVRVRKALAHLLNRELINEKFLYGYSGLATGPWSFQSVYADKNVKPILFDPKKAKQILKQAGWSDQDRNGVLEKTIRGQKKELVLDLLYSNADAEKYYTIFQQDLKQAGVKLNLKILDWTSLLRLVDDGKFDMVGLGWGAGSIDLDPKQIWHSASAYRGGSNFINYKNPKVDALIDRGRKQMDRNERIQTFRQVYRLIAKDVPYIFMFVSPYTFYGVNKRIHRPKPSLQYSIGIPYWKMKEVR